MTETYVARSLAGVLTVLPTPFLPNGDVDADSLDSLVEHAILAGSSGLVCFGLASEVYKLDEAERRRILGLVIDQARGRLPIIAGSEGNSTHTAVARTSEAVELGAEAVMVAPPSFVIPSADAVIEYYVDVAKVALGRTVIVQDAPTWTGVALPVELLERIRAHAPNVDHVKVENPPNAAKIRALRESGFTAVSGFGALHLLEDVVAGATAVMPGAGVIDWNVTVWDAAASSSSEAWRLFQQLLPLLSFQMSSLDTFIATQKEILMARGVITSRTVRTPGRELNPDQSAWLKGILSRLGEPESGG
jgi:4-hydroxy-tetrahydrodipicolinate synthase